MDEAPGRVPPADREWGWCRQITPALRRLLDRKQLWRDGTDHVVVLRYDARNIILICWAGSKVIGYLTADASVGRDIARLGAPERV